MIVPEPNGRVSVVVPSDQRVIVPLPNFCVLPVMVLPSRPRSVVIEPEPKGLVWLLVPSERFVMVPEPNWLVVPLRGWAIPARGGVGSAAARRPAANPRSMQAQSESVRRNRSGLLIDRSPKASRKHSRG